MNNYRLDASVGPPFLESFVGIAEPSCEAPSSVVSLTWAAAELRFQGYSPPCACEKTQSEAICEIDFRKSVGFTAVSHSRGR